MIDTLAQLIYAQLRMPPVTSRDLQRQSWPLKVGEEYDSIEDISGALLLMWTAQMDVRLSDVADVEVSSTTPRLATLWPERRARSRAEDLQARHLQRQRGVGQLPVRLPGVGPSTTAWVRGSSVQPGQLSPSSSRASCGAAWSLAESGTWPSSCWPSSVDVKLTSMSASSIPGCRSCSCGADVLHRHDSNVSDAGRLVAGHRMLGG